MNSLFGVRKGQWSKETHDQKVILCNIFLIVSRYQQNKTNGAVSNSGWYIAHGKCSVQGRRWWNMLHTSKSCLLSYQFFSNTTFPWEHHHNSRERMWKIKIWKCSLFRKQTNICLWWQKSLVLKKNRWGCGSATERSSLPRSPSWSLLPFNR